MTDLVLVPPEPTREMLQAMFLVLGIDPDRRAEDILDALDVNRAAQTLEAYRAMVRAAQSGIQ